MQDWIAQRRKELTTQRDQFAANANMCVGALEMLTAIEAEMAKQPSVVANAADEQPAP